MAELVVGGVPRGDDYFDQQQLIETLWERLKRDNVLLVAPRRFGKTAAMFCLRDAPRDGFRPVYLDVEHLASAANFMVELLALLLRDRHFSRVAQRLWDGVREFGDWIRNLPASVDVGGVKVELREKTDVPVKWLEYADRLMAMLEEEDTKLLLLVDEFPVMITAMLKRDRQEAEQFLRWFRTVRIHPDTRTRFVIGGSTNIMYSLEAAGLVDVVNDLYPMRLRLFSSATAGEYLQAMFDSRGLHLPPEVRRRIVELVGEPVPYLLALLIQCLFERIQVEGADVTVELVERAFNEDLLGGGQSLFLHYWSRLREHYPEPESMAAKTILSLLSRGDSPVSRNMLYHRYLLVSHREDDTQAQDDFLRLMWKLDNDFYVVSSDDGYAFLSRVLKLWWRRYYGYQED